MRVSIDNSGGMHSRRLLAPAGISAAEIESDWVTVHNVRKSYNISEPGQRSSLSNGLSQT